MTIAHLPTCVKPHLVGKTAYVFAAAKRREYLRVQWNSQTVLNWSNKKNYYYRERMIMIRICHTYTCLCVHLQRREHSYWLLRYARSCKLIRFSFCALISAVSVRYKHVRSILPDSGSWYLLLVSYPKTIFVIACRLQFLWSFRCRNEINGIASDHLADGNWIECTMQRITFTSNQDEII